MLVTGMKRGLTHACPVGPGHVLQLFLTLGIANDSKLRIKSSEMQALRHVVHNRSHARTVVRWYGKSSAIEKKIRPKLLHEERQVILNLLDDSGPLTSTQIFEKCDRTVLQTMRSVKRMLAFLKSRKLIMTRPPADPSDKYTFQVSKKFSRRRELERTHESTDGRLLQDDLPDGEPPKQQQQV